jgi:hypothetical protein
MVAAKLPCLNHTRKNRTISRKAEAIKGGSVRKFLLMRQLFHLAKQKTKERALDL